MIYILGVFIIYVNKINFYNYSSKYKKISHMVLVSLFVAILFHAAGQGSCGVRIIVNQLNFEHWEITTYCF